MLITGAGPIGIMAAAVVRHAGRAVRRRHRRQPVPAGAGEEDGRHARGRRQRDSDLPDVQKELGMKEGFDVGLEMSGNAAAFRDMLANMATAARSPCSAFPEKEMAIDWNTVIFNMLTIKGIYGREMYETWYKMTVMLQSGLDICPVITHRFHYTEFQKGFEVVSQANPARSS